MSGSNKGKGRRWKGSRERMGLSLGLKVFLIFSVGGLMRLYKIIKE